MLRLHPNDHVLQSIDLIIGCVEPRVIAKEHPKRRLGFRLENVVAVVHNRNGPHRLAVLESTKDLVGSTHHAAFDSGHFRTH